METLRTYSLVPITQNVLQERMVEYQSPKDKLSRLTREGTLLRLKRGLYSVPGSITGQHLSRELIANHLYGPSYVSFESALSYYGLIPERVYVQKSATLKRRKEYNTPIGLFQYIHIPEDYYPIGLKLELIEDSYAYIMATPEKAICDLILSTSGLRLQSIKSVGEYLISDLRIELDELVRLDTDIIEACASNGYKNSDLRNLLRFVHRIRK